MHSCVLQLHLDYTDGTESLVKVILVHICACHTALYCSVEFVRKFHNTCTQIYIYYIRSYSPDTILGKS